MWVFCPKLRISNLCDLDKSGRHMQTYVKWPHRVGLKKKASAYTSTTKSGHFTGGERPSGERPSDPKAAGIRKRWADKN